MDKPDKFRSPGQTTKRLVDFHDREDSYISSYNFLFIFSVMDNKLCAVRKSRF